MTPPANTLADSAGETIGAVKSLDRVFIEASDMVGDCGCQRHLGPTFLRKRALNC
jgi:hypothetical protein